MSAAYSNRFTLKAGGNSSYVVPAGKRAIIKTLSGGNPTAAGQVIGVQNANCLVLYKQVAPGADLTLANLHVVFNQGELMDFQGSSGIHYQASGYLLDA